MVLVAGILFSIAIGVFAWFWIDAVSDRNVLRDCNAMLHQTLDTERGYHAKIVMENRELQAKLAKVRELVGEK